MPATERASQFVIANDNCPGQIVISGGARAVEVAIEHQQAGWRKTSANASL
jgi:malonyl CoA-acyl carrier protein transacylase